MNRSAGKIKFASYDDLFGSMTENGGEAIGQELPVDCLRPFHNHPYQVLDDTRMEDLVESIRQNGVLNPGIVRKIEGGYELISGHRRKRACELAGIKTMPVIIKELTDDEAAVLVVDSNLYREKMLPSEKAKAYRLKMEALKHQGKKWHQPSAALIGRQERESERTVFRYIRMTYLIPELLEYVDQNKLSQTSAESISFLQPEEQEWIRDEIVRGKIPNKQEALELKRVSEQKKLTSERVREILKKMPARKPVTLSAQRVQEYFPAHYSREQIENVIFKLLDSWKGREN